MGDFDVPVGAFAVALAIAAAALLVRHARNKDDGLENPPEDGRGVSVKPWVVATVGSWTVVGVLVIVIFDWMDFSEYVGFIALYEALMFFVSAAGLRDE